MPEGNPLVAQAQSQTTGVTGIGIAESAVDLANGVSDGSWVEAGLGAVGVGLEVLSLVVDPIGTLASYGVSWLIEHVQPLKEALDWLAGDPPVIQSFSDTWANVAAEVNAIAGDLGNEVTNGTAGWQGEGADAYRGAAAEQADALAGAASLADGISAGVMIMGTVVAAVRELVRDLVAELVGKLITWALEAAGTLGFATPVIAVQATTAISKTITKISDFIRKLVKTIGNVSPKIRKIIDKLGEIIEKLSKMLRKGGKPGSSTTPSGAKPNTTTTPDTTPNSPDTTPSGADTTPDTGSTPDGGKPGSTTPDSSSPGSNRPDDVNDTKTPIDQRKCENDPIDVATGEMVLAQTDVELAGVLSLVLRRTHISSYRAGLTFGPSWASTVDQRLEFDAEGVLFVAEDGMLLAYPAPPDTGSVLPAAGPRWPLSRSEDGFTIQRDSGQSLHFPAGPGAVQPLTRIEDRSGNRITVERDGAGIPLAVQHSGGYRVEFEHEGGRAVTLRLAETDGDGIVLLRYGYDERGRLTEVVNSSGRPLRFDYDLAGRITQWTDRNGEWYRYFYDAQGRCIANQGSGGFLNGTFGYDEDGRGTRFTDALGNTTTYRFDERNNVIAETDPLGHTWRQEWDAHDRLISRTDPLGRTTRYEYDQDGNLTRLTRPDGTQALAEHNELGRPTVTVDPDGAVWRRAYDHAGRVVSITNPAGVTTTCTYHENGQLASVTDGLGRTRRTEVDAAGLPVAEIDVRGQVTRYQRDQFGRIVSVTDPSGATARMTWTVEGKLLSRTAPDGSVERWQYDGEGNEVAYQDAAGRGVTVQTTHFDLPAVETRTDGSKLTFTYDAALRLRTVTNAQHLEWRYDYDAAGRLVAETDFNGRRIQYEHDEAGHLVARTNGLGQRIEFVRDRAGRMLQRRYDGTAEYFEYDPVGRLVRARNNDADLVLERDVLGQVIAESVNGQAVTSAYDAAGRRIARRTPTGAESRWQYGESGQPTALATAGHTISFGYDAAGHEVERLLDSGTIIAQSWDANHRLTGQTVSTVAGGGRARLIQRRDFSYRADGHLVAVDDQLDGPRSFQLDGGGRITAVRGAGWTEQYAYDSGGNVRAAEWSGGDTEAHGERAYHGTLLTRAGKLRYEHDQQGRVVLRQKKRLSAKPETWHYSWNADDRLVGVVTPDGSHWRYLYDPLGRRIAKLRLGPGGTVLERTDFCWDGLQLAEQVHSGGHALTWDWAPGTFRPISQVQRVRSADQGWIDSQFYSIVTDLVGTPTELVDASGALGWRRRSTIWGHDVGSAPQQAGTPLRFPGQYFDPESGLNYNHFRHYDAETGRYVSTDPMGLAPGPNPQAYVPNPTAATDPTGLSPCRTYYSVQGRADADRLINDGGEPWPSGVDAQGRPRSELGEGLYAWETRDQAERYLEMVRSRDGAPTDLEIIEHRIRGEDFDGLRSADMTTMDDDAATDLWNQGSNHDYEHIRRGTGRFGPENYFHHSVYHLFETRRPG
ncbi:DUF6531 domain-containing protein [Amycolatopsis albispora]|uniref:Type IV secretion protein Rhs n=1 Tax=Amycolatopsis albispora TaxID=1804986 RepID=A0A344LII3_9PSEU|nr:DUF6531 domain-containing protein [Amycolatopsis albispora]AXB47857.1 type IV secretion protein Rhs [Amycolatopsis albispora]